jgi:hypothetical protein
MQQISKDTHPSLYLLADHLDAALAMGEDLLACKVTLGSAQDTSATSGQTMHRLETQNRALRVFMGEARTLELALVSRLLQARKWAEELRNSELGLKPVIALFVAGTAQFADHVAEIGDPTNSAFETGNTVLAYLRSRGMIEADEVSLAAREDIAVTDELLVMGLARLGTLLDLVATFLDTLDLLGDLRLAETQPMAATVPGEQPAPLPN